MSAPMTLPVQIGPNTWTLTFKMGTIRKFEEETGIKLDRAFPFLTESDDAARRAAAESVTWATWLTMFWASLQFKHQITRDGADDLSDLAGMESVIEWVMRGMTAYLTGNPELLTAPIGEGDAEGESGKGKKAKKAGNSQTS